MSHLWLESTHKAKLPPYPLPKFHSTADRADPQSSRVTPLALSALPLAHLFMLAIVYWKCSPMNVDFSFYYQPEAKSLFLKTREYFLGFYTYHILFRAFL